MTVGESICPLDDLRDNAAEAVARVNQTGVPEFITVDGKVAAVLLSPSHYEAMAKEYWLNRDVETIRRSMKEYREGKGRDASECFRELRAELLAMKAKEDAESTRPTSD